MSKISPVSSQQSWVSYVKPQEKDATWLKVAKCVGHLATIGLVFVGAYLVDLTNKTISYLSDDGSKKVQNQELTKSEKVREYTGEASKGIQRGLLNCALIPKKAIEHNSKALVKSGYLAGYILGTAALLGMVGKFCTGTSGIYLGLGAGVTGMALGSKTAHSYVFTPLSERVVTPLLEKLNLA